MKKLLGIVVLGLLWCGNSYAKTKIEKALENCADKAYYSITDIKNFTPSLYSSSSEYQKLKKSLEENKVKKKKASDEALSKITKWWDENPSPKRSDYKQVTTSIGTLDWPGYDEDREKRNKAERQYVIEITKKQKLLEQKQKSLEKRIETTIRGAAFVYIKHSDMSLKIKAKMVKGYMKYYKNCEIEYQSTPSSFMLEWGD